MTDDDLQEVVAAACRGSRDAESRLYQRFHRFVERRLSEARRKRNWFWLTELEDAVQDVFIQFFSAIKKGRFQFQSEEELKGFLIKTSFFVSMNLKDKKPRERAFSQFQRDEEQNPMINLVAFSEDLYENQQRKDCLKLLYQCVEELSKNRREIILRTLLGEKVRDICAATGRSPASVSGLKFNALKDLKQRLDQRSFLEHCAEAMAILEGKGEGT